MINAPDPRIPYNSLPNLPPIGGLADDSEILKKSISVAQSLASLNATMQADNNSISYSMDLMSPLYVPEAVMSSSVENIVTTNESVYEARLMDADSVSPQNKEVMHYMDALINGARALRKKGYLATNEYIEIQKVLEPKKPGIRKIPGTQISNPITKQIYYTPPNGEKNIRRLLKNFEEYFNASPSPHEVFMRAAILHYQFEAIHPFFDGNGRTGRILIPLYLTKHDILDVPLLFVSRYILQNREQYYKLLRNVTFRSEWKPWIIYMLEALEEQAKYTVLVIQKINYFKKGLVPKIESVLGQGHSNAVADFLYAHPFFVRSEFEDSLNVSYVTSRKYLSCLLDKGIVLRRRQARKNRYIYACPEYINLLKNT